MAKRRDWVLIVVLAVFGAAGEGSRALAQECQTSADCEDGFECELADEEVCTAARDGGASECHEVQATMGTCTYEPVECESDADCDGELVCTVLDVSRECEGGLSGCSDDDCPPPEETCTEIERKYCFPERQDCEADADCDGDSRCVAWPENDRDDPPEGWEGVTKACFPEGIALVLEGSAEAKGHSSASDESGGGADRPARDSDSDAADGASGEDADDGCSVSAKAGRVGLPTACWAAAALLFVRRRRRG